MLRLYWDGYGLGTAASGVSVHARCLGSELARLGEPPTVVASAATGQLFPGLPLTELTPRLSRICRLKPVWPELVGRCVAAAEAGSLAPYVLHGLSNFNLPLLGRDRRRRGVLTVHDLIPWLAPDGVSTALRLQLGYLLPRALRRADAVVCVSQWTKATLVERFPFVADRCRVIANGIDAAALAPSSQDQTAGKPWTDLLYIARFEAYKQHALLLKIVQAASQKWRLTLVIDQQGEATCRRWAPDLVAAGRLRFYSQLSQPEIAALHAASDVYVSPSLYEGYCLPAAASLLAKRPVVYLGGSGIDEVVGERVGIKVTAAATLSTWQTAIDQALALGRQADFGDQVSTHLRQLTTWKDAAQQLLSLYYELI